MEEVTASRAHIARRRGVALAIACVLSLAVCLAPIVARAVSPSPQLLKRMAHDPALRKQIHAQRKAARLAGVDKPPLVTYGPRGRMVPNTGVSTGVPSTSPILRATASAGRPLRLLVLLVDFSDNVHTASSFSFDSLIFEDVVGPASVRGYYNEISAGALDIQPVSADLPSTIGWLRMPQPYSYYVGTDSGTGAYPNNARRLFEDAAAAAELKGVDFSQYDNDGDGVIDGVFVVHAGSGAEFSGRASDIWSHQWWALNAATYDGVTLGSYSTEPEYWAHAGDMTVGVYCHEFGHVLGLPDLYDTTDASQGLGDWSLMAGGSWTGTTYVGDSPSRPDAWSLVKLGFASSTPVTGTVVAETIAAASSTAEGTILRVAKGAATGGSEYFLIENRRKTGTDSGLPGSGLLIYHVDDARFNHGDNDDASHYLVGLEEAHGGTQNLHFTAAGGGNSGDAGDPFPGTSSNRTFSDTSSPSAAYFSGPSGIRIDDISASATMMTAVVTPDVDAAAADKTPPATTSDALASYDGTATISLSATDASSGIAYTRWLLDGTPGTGNIVVEPAYGSHTLKFWSADAVGNIEPSNTAAFFVHDIDPPSISDDAIGSYDEMAAIHIFGTDTANGSGVASVSYRVDATATQTVPSAAATIAVSGAGMHSIQLWCTDGDGNSSAVSTREFTVIVDLTPPVTTSDAASTYEGTATITLSPADAGVGLASTHWLLDGVEGSGTAIVEPAYGAHTLEYWSTDLSGNAEAPVAVGFFVNDIDVPSASCNAAGSYATIAWIDLAAQDPPGGSGIASLSYRLDGEATVTVTAALASVGVTTAGSHTLAYWTVDGAGNSSAPTTAEFRVIDATAVRISSGNRTVSAGTRIPVTGWIDPESTLVPLLGQKLRLQRYSSGTWVSAGARDSAVEADGMFAFSLTAWSNATLRVVTPPGSTLLYGASPSMRVRVRAVLTRPYVPSRTYARRYFTVTGAALPHNIRTVSVRWYRVSSTGHRRFYASKTVAVSSTGRWALRKKLPRGRWAVRASHSDSSHIASFSTFRTFRVR